MDRPDPADIIELRQQVQERQQLGITAAQDHCAKALHTDRRSWQRWERDERRMHPAFWELAQLKLGS